MWLSIRQLKTVFVLVGLFCFFMLSSCGGGGGSNNGGGSSGSGLSSSKEMASFRVNGIDANINQQEKTILFTLPYGSDLTKVDVDFTTTGSIVTVGGIRHQVNLLRISYDFTSYMVIQVTAEDGSTNEYTAIGTVATKTAGEIIGFSLKEFPNNVAIIDELTGTITLTLPHGTILSTWVANFETTGGTVSVNDIPQVNGETPNDFSKDVIYTVTPAVGPAKQYKVVILQAADTAKKISNYSISGHEAVIDELAGTISLTLPFDYSTKLSSLIATFEEYGESVTVYNGVGHIVQVSNETANDFSKGGVVYTAHAADGSSKDYTVNITVAKNTANDLINYSIMGFPKATVTYTGQNIDVLLQYGVDLISKTYIAKFDTTGVKVAIGEDEQRSEYTGNNFNTPLTYIVTAANGDTKEYTVTVRVSLPFIPFYPKGCVMNNQAENITGNCECVQDSTTHDIWLVQPSDGNKSWDGTSGTAPGAKAWVAAKNTNGGSCGFNAGWELPTNAQLTTMVNYVKNQASGTRGTWFNNHGFLGIHNEGSYWGAEVGSPLENSAWMISLMGNVDFSGKYISNPNYYAWAVHSEAITEDHPL